MTPCIKRFGAITENSQGRLVFEGFHVDGRPDVKRMDQAVIKAVIAKLQAELAAIKAAHGCPDLPPEGYKLAPIEPTPEMAAAAQRWVAAGVEAVYRAMLEAAP